MITFCTYFDRNFLTRGLVLHASLRAAMPDLDLVVLALDRETADVLGELALPGVEVLALATLEAQDPKVAATKPSRSRVEYYFTLTPALPLAVLGLRPHADVVTYVDADLRFYSDPRPLLGRLDSGNVLIVPHGFPPRLARFLKHGTFNVGLVAWRRTAEGIACLERWRSQCIDWCYDRVDGSRFADQGYLNDWPSTVPGTVVADSPGVGLAPWNVMRYAVDPDADPPTADGDPIVFYHFQGVAELRGGLWTTGLAPYGGMDRGLRQKLYGAYIAELESAARRLHESGLGDVIARTARSAPLRRLARAVLLGDLYRSEPVVGAA